MHQRAYNESGVGCVVVDTGCDEVELLIQASSAGLEVDWNQVLAEVACRWVDEETLAVRCFEGDAGEGTGCSVVSFVCFGC